MTKNDSPEELTDRQLKAIPHLISSSTLEDGRKKAGVSKNALYTWLRNPIFKDELKKQQDIVIAEAMESLKSNIGKAISVLVGLLDTESDSLKRLVANDIIGHSLKAIEMQEIEYRLDEIEQIVFGKKR